MNCEYCSGHLYNCIIHKNKTSLTIPYKYCFECDKIFRVSIKELKRMKGI